MKGQGLYREQLSRLWARQKTKDLFNSFTKKVLAGAPNATRDYIVNNMRRTHGESAFDVTDAGDVVMDYPK